MKKLILAFLASLVTCITMAQVNFGVKGGVNISTIRLTSGDAADRVLDFHAGGLAQVKLSDIVSLQPEIVYSRQGMKSRLFTRNISYEDQLHYVNIPVMAKYTAESGFHLHSGPQFGFLLSAKTTQPDVDGDKSHFYKGFDFAWVLGAGHLTRAGIGIDGRFNFSLTNMAKPEGATHRQSVWQIGLYYQFK
jgi:hypothetical protein